ncbi:F0F1 ATP synthase subunit A [Deferribacterales bacterium RsTz2092]|nr:ATP synthase subunit a [Deferribacterales bacterium]
MEHPMTIISFLPPAIQERYGHVVMLSVVAVIVFCIGLVVRRMTNDVPTRSQALMEGLIRYLYDMGENVMGHEGAKYMPFLISIAFYVAISNLTGLIPGLFPPTTNMNTTAAPAVCVFLFYQYLGVKKHGAAKYISHFLGPILPLAPLMFLIELVGQFARPLSLTMRLFGNVTGEEIIVTILFMIAPFIVPLPMYVLGLFTGLLQAFVFMLLSMVYIGGAIEEAH